MLKTVDFDKPLTSKTKFHFEFLSIQAIVALHLLNFSMESGTSDDV